MHKRELAEVVAEVMSDEDLNALIVTSVPIHAGRKAPEPAASIRQNDEGEPGSTPDKNVPPFHRSPKVG